MKVIKKISVYLLVGFLFCSSVVFSYEKANTCKAVSIAFEIGAVLLLGAALYGCYYVSQPDTQEEIKESLTNYKDMTVENAKIAYEANKQVWSDFHDYVMANNKGSGIIYTAGGQSFTLNQLQKQGFPDFDDWNNFMKKNIPSGGGLSSWDKFFMALDVLDVLADFFKKNYDGAYLMPNESRYYENDDYIDRKTGRTNIQLTSYAWRTNYAHTNQSNLDVFKDFEFYNDYYDYTVSFIARYPATQRYAYYIGIPESFGGYQPTYLNVNKEYYCQRCWGYLYYTNNGSGYYRLSAYWDSLDGTKRVSGEMYSMKNDTPDFLTSYVSEPKNYTFLSTNVPVFDDFDKLKNYLATGSTDGILNMRPAEVTEAPSDPTLSTRSYASDSYCNYFKNRGVSGNNVTDFNTDIATYIVENNLTVDNTNTTYVENITQFINDYTHDGELGDAEEPVATATPVPTLPNDDGGNTTNNYFINITNILQPMYETVTNIYNFFIIDTDTIGEEINNINVLPAKQFENFVATFGNLSNTFSDNMQEECTEGQHGIKYPVIKVQCPKILLDFVPDDSSVVIFEDGICYLVLADCIKFAKYFVKVRAFLKACIWIGMIFYLMKELKPVITLSD